MQLVAHKRLVALGVAFVTSALLLTGCVSDLGRVSAASDSAAPASSTGSPSTATATPGAPKVISVGSSPYVSSGGAGDDLLLTSSPGEATFRSAAGWAYRLVDATGESVTWKKQPDLQIAQADAGAGALIVSGIKSASDLGGSETSVVVRIDPKTGSTVWSKKMGSAAVSLGRIASSVIEVVEFGSATNDHGHSYTTTTSHFLDTKTGKERFKFGTCSLSGNSMGALDGQGVVSLDPFVTRPGKSVTSEEDGHTDPCDSKSFGTPQLRSLSTGEVTGAASDEAVPDYLYADEVFSTGTHFIVRSANGDRISAVTPEGKTAWSQSASAAKVLTADTHHVVVDARQTNKIVVLDSKTGHTVQSIDKVFGDVSDASLFGAHQLALVTNSGIVLYTLVD